MIIKLFRNWLRAVDAASPIAWLVCTGLKGELQWIPTSGWIVVSESPCSAFQQRRRGPANRAFDQELANDEGWDIQLSAEYFSRNILAGIKLQVGVEMDGPLTITAS